MRAPVPSLLLVLVAAAGCEPGYFYGVAGGVATPIGPSQAGGYGAATARREYAPAPRSMGSYFAAEGAVVAFASHDSLGAVPLLLGSGGGRAGPMRYYLEGGAQLPGYLERYDHKVVSLFGLVGGVGIGVALGEHVELHLGGRVLWSSRSMQADIQTSARKDEFLFVFGGLTLHIRLEPRPPLPSEETF
jgi:hypothetical protein